MREFRTPGSARGTPGNRRSYLNRPTSTRIAMNRCPEHTLKKWPSCTQFLAEGLILLLNRPLYGLVQHLESHCVYGCCGMDAFDITASNAQLWLEVRGGAAASALSGTAR